VTKEQQQIVVRHAKKVIALHRHRTEAMSEDPVYRSLFVLADGADPHWEAGNQHRFALPEIALGTAEPLVGLIETTREDKSFRQEISAILRLPPFHRHTFLNGWIEEARRRAAPAEFVAALSALLDDDIAAKARQLI